MGFKSISYMHLVLSTDEASGMKAFSHDIFVSYIFPIASETEQKKFMKHIFNHPQDRHFSITINQWSFKFDEGEWLKRLFLILSHPFYYKHENRPVIGIDTEQRMPEEAREFVKTLSSKLDVQEFRNVGFALIAENSAGSSNNIHFYDSTNFENFEKWYFGKLMNADGLLDIYIKSGTGKNVDDLIAQKKVADELLQKDNPNYARLLSSAIETRIALAEREALIEVLADDVVSKKKYLDFLLNEFKESKADKEIEFSPIMKIKKFYHQEYEVLPLWYKRFGHILKVLMGKRSFKSLFDDNLKNR